MVTVSGSCVRALVFLPEQAYSFKSCLLMSIWLFLSLSRLHYVVFASESMSCFANLPSSIHKTCPNHLNLLAFIINSNFWSVVFLTSSFLSVVVILERENWRHARIDIARILKKKPHVTCEIMGGYIWCIEWDWVCHTAPILLCIDLFVFICVCFCFILHSCCIIVSMVG